MSYHQHQYLHSSVLPHLVGMDNRKAPRPLSEATSIASSIDFEDPYVHQMAHARLSKAPSYRYSSYGNMELPEDAEEGDYIIDDIHEEDEDEDEHEENYEPRRGEPEDSLYNKALRMNNWLSDGARDSVGSDGMKTASSCDEAKTPTTPPLDFGAPQPMQMSMKRTTVGPRGPHLFSTMFLQPQQNEEHLEDEYLSPISPVRENSYPSPYSSRKSPVGSQHSLLQVPQAAPMHHISIDVDVNERPVSAMSMALHGVEESEIENWSPMQVCSWMSDLGFEETLIEKFRQNDISGAILMQLKWEDLKELDIQSFGKRIELWSELNHLRKSPIVSSSSPKRDLSFETSSVHSPPLLSRHASKKSRESKFRHSPSLPAVSPSSYASSPSTVTRSNTVATSRPSAPSPRKHAPVLRISTDVASLQHRPRFQVSAPPESESEEEEDEIEEVDEFSDHDQYSPPPMEEKRRPTGLSIIIPDSTLAIPRALNSAESKSSHTPSHEGRRHKPAPRFAAPNPAKRRVSKRLSTPISPVSASIEIFAAPSVLGLTMGKRASMLEAESPRWDNHDFHARSPWAPSICASSDVLSPSDRGDVKLKADELRKVSALTAQEQVNKFITLQHLQRLEERAPSNLKNEMTRESESPVSPHGTYPINSQPPPPMTKAVQRSTSLRTFDRHKPRALQLSNEAVAPGPASAGFTPRNTDDVRNYQPPEVVQPKQPQVTARPVPPLLRSSTAPSPPLGTQNPPQLVRSASVASPKPSQTSGALRSNSISGISRKPSFSGSSKKPPSLGKSLIDTVNEEAEWEDTSSHGSAPASPSERVFTGEMKKRTNHFLRNEWISHRVELRGTKLTVYKTTNSRDILATIEIDDYSVTCTTSGSNKFKGLKTGSKKDSDGMYHFQLVPNQDTKKVGEQKKEQHFAVSSREERIDWMRELMLAKAIKQKKSGFQVEVNGKMM
ncbi:hypothetical protein TWF481_012284 [Arthrobotrys musiformis]|uniref:Uncharacterized protein n=1 Tax=Arthrobotrys musiformis TaxID=47236 RepID=A0AAV9VWJ1_9PEZI